MMRLLLIITLVLTTSNVVLARSKAQPPKALKDVPKTHWASDAVQDLYDSGVMVGDPTGAFRGNTPITRYEMAVALSSLINNYNKELLEDREDLASLVNIMEQFQNELSALNQKITTLSQEIGSMTGTVNVVQEQSEEIAAQVDETGAQLAVIKQDVDKLKNRGLIYGTIIKGTANDIKSVGKGAAYVAKKITERKPKEEDKASKEVEAEVLKQVIVPKPAQPVVEEPVQEPSVQEEVIEEEPVVAPVVAPVVETKKAVAPVVVPPAHKEPVLQDSARHSYVPKMQASPVAAETTKSSAPPAPKPINKTTDSHHSHEYSQELDGELIQEIHQTLQEMH